MRKSYSCAERDEEVIASKDRSNTNTKDSEEEVEHDKRGFGDVSSLVREAEESVCAVTDYETHDDAEDALPEDGDQEPFFKCFSRA